MKYLCISCGNVFGGEGCKGYGRPQFDKHFEKCKGASPYEIQEFNETGEWPRKTKKH